MSLYIRSRNMGKKYSSSWLKAINLDSGNSFFKQFLLRSFRLFPEGHLDQLTIDDQKSLSYF